jgi:hypothetical protein
MMRPDIAYQNDLWEFKAAGFKRIAESLKHPDGRAQNPNNNAVEKDMIATPRYASWLHLEASDDIVRYYKTCGWSLTALNMQWNPTTKWYHEYWVSLEEQLKDCPTALPKITKALPIMKWAEPQGQSRKLMMF